MTKPTFGGGFGELESRIFVSSGFGEQVSTKPTLGGGLDEREFVVSGLLDVGSV